VQSSILGVVVWCLAEKQVGSVRCVIVKKKLISIYQPKIQGA